ncbi:hypothetical protein [Pseudoalteromonas sp. Of7M-16]|uniref:hypothetical protein n=1 Tax=Pseudoalteromonas sp. Of7M-16 TaxID=2917756 RepID=UPI001EF632CF|nr:hypothetical protein [Pseudoalteromonas sp. Of7M-16]MCG7551336.1 hypothetical protein [Pseudoalteromonas sp. Of7M-16]
MQSNYSEVLKTRYGSLAQLARLCGMDRTTLYRVLDGKYTGDINPHIKTINTQLEKDSVDLRLDAEELIKVTVPRNILGRIESLIGTVRTVSNHCPERTKGIMELIEYELEDICQTCEQ